MERVRTLIEKLQQQANENMPAEKILLTAQMLLAELQQQQIEIQKSKVSIIMPQPHMVIPNDEPINKAINASNKNGYAKKEEVSGWLFDPIDIPTLTHQNSIQTKDIIELNDVIIFDEPNINSKLSENKIELADTLHALPIKDLRKAIGLNDRYLLINELFRGDEIMFDRSLKTINDFTIYAEAQYWIQRELKVKMSWNEQSEIVQLFDQFVKRRFS
jgi:hypothetical protein